MAKVSAAKVRRKIEMRNTISTAFRITYVGYFADSDHVIPVRCQQFVDEIDDLLAPPRPVVGGVEAPIVNPGMDVFLLEQGIKDPVILVLSVNTPNKSYIIVDLSKN